MTTLGNVTCACMRQVCPDSSWAGLERVTSIENLTVAHLSEATHIRPRRAGAVCAANLVAHPCLPMPSRSGPHAPRRAHAPGVARLLGGRRLVQNPRVPDRAHRKVDAAHGPAPAHRGTLLARMHEALPRSRGGSLHLVAHP
jgi:hypothetical protein